MIINGSPRKDGNTTVALNEVITTLQAEGIETVMFEIGTKALRGCMACLWCAKNGRCVIDDEVNEVARLFKECDGVVIGSPVYYASANGTLSAFLDRLFYSTPFDKRMKVGAGEPARDRGRWRHLRVDRGYLA